MIDTPLPDLLRETMADFGMGTIDKWWQELDQSSRGDVIQLWRETGLNSPCRARVVADFVDDSEPEDDEALWHHDFYEYLVNHEVYYVSPASVHICTRHSQARAAAAAGFISKDFVCPLEDGQCPMRRLLHLSPGKSARLRIAFNPQRREE